MTAYRTEPRPPAHMRPSRARQVVERIWEHLHPHSEPFTVEGNSVPVTRHVSHVRVLSPEEADRRRMILGERTEVAIGGDHGRR